MPQERAQRKLTTIFVADVVGYSHLMHSDEEATLRALEENRGVISRLITDHDGRIFNTGGDSVLAEFPSAVEALRCAISFQNDASSRREQTPEDRPLLFRIGINIGDVMIRDGDLFGDGVNIAARIESLADPGGICISAGVHEQVKNKVAVGFDDLGLQTVKNIADPVHVYRVGTKTPAAPPDRRKTRSLPISPVVVAVVVALLVIAGLTVWSVTAPGLETAQEDRMMLPLPNQPSIAALPFTNIGTAPNQDLLSDGIVRDIITDLSAFADLLVISATSSFNYKDKPWKTHEVAEELGVRFVLDGSIQTIDDNVRINIQLVDAISGEQIWADRYNRAAGDIFAIQDEITENVVAVLGAIEGPIALADRQQTRAKRDTSLTAYEYVLLARDARNLWTAEGNAQSLELVQKAIEVDPTYARAYVELAWTYFQDATRYQSQPPGQSAKNAIESALTAIELDNTFAEAHWVAGDIYAWVLREPEKALAAYDRALALNPNHADILAAWGGWILPSVLDRPDEGVAIMQKAMRLSPFHEDWFNWGMMNAYFMAQDFEQAVLAFESIKHPSFGFHLRRVASLGYLGRTEEAEAAIQEVLKKKPAFTVTTYLEERRGYPAYEQLLRDGLLLTGLPE